MNDDFDHILVDGCDLCKYFKNPESITMKLHYPNNVSLVKNSDFIIIESNTGPMIIINDHITDISKELWGKILYTSKKLYGDIIRLKIDKCKDYMHWNARVMSSDRGD